MLIKKHFPIFAIALAIALSPTLYGMQPQGSGQGSQDKRSWVRLALDHKGKIGMGVFAAALAGGYLYWRSASRAALAQDDTALPTTESFKEWQRLLMILMTKVVPSSTEQDIAQLLENTENPAQLEAETSFMQPLREKNLMTDWEAVKAAFAANTDAQEQEDARMLADFSAEVGMPAWVKGLLQVFSAVMPEKSVQENVELVQEIQDPHALLAKPDFRKLLKDKNQQREFLAVLKHYSAYSFDVGVKMSLTKVAPTLSSAIAQLKTIEEVETFFVTNSSQFSAQDREHGKRIIDLLRLYKEQETEFAKLIV